MEAVYNFPTDPESVVSRVVFDLGNGKTIETKVKEIEEAKETYSDALARGNAAMLLEENSQDKDLLKLSIGGIHPNQQVKVMV